MSPFELLPRAESVDLWVARRLPFEPRGDLLAARNAVRDALRRMRLRQGQILSAAHRSRDDASCDVENVLLYNVGSAAFSHLTRDGVAFERLREAPPPPPSGAEFAHHHLYAASDPIVLKGDPSTTSLSFDTTDVALTKVHEVWRAAARADAPLATAMPGRFGLHVTLESPSKLPSAASIVKPFLDGIIAALHRQERPDEEAVRRLSERTGWPREEIAGSLQNPAAPILGERHVLRPYRAFVKWDPADDLCDRCVLLIRASDRHRCKVQIRAM